MGNIAAGVGDTGWVIVLRAGGDAGFFGVVTGNGNVDTTGVAAVVSTATGFAKAVDVVCTLDETVLVGSASLGRFDADGMAVTVGC